MANFIVSFGHIQAGSSWDLELACVADTARLAVAKGEQLVPKLSKCLDQLTIIRSVRAAEVGGNGQTFPKSVNVPGTQESETTSYSDIVKSTVMIKLYSDGNAYRSMGIRGVTDKAIERTPNGAYNPTPKFRTALNAFIAEIVNLDFSIQSRVKPTAGPGNAFRPVAKITPAVGTNNEQTVINTIGVHGFANGDLIDFSLNSRDIFQLPYKGQFVVLNNAVLDDASAFMIDAQYVAGGESHIPKRMRTRVVEYTYPLIRSGAFDRFTSRDTRSVDGSRGRSRGVSYRH